MRPTPAGVVLGLVVALAVASILLADHVVLAGKLALIALVLLVVGLVMWASESFS